MASHIVTEMMNDDFITWRCLHNGPLSDDKIDRWPSGSDMSWEHYRARNRELLEKLAKTYGACAVTAKSGNSVVGLFLKTPR